MTPSFALSYNLWLQSPQGIEQHSLWRADVETSYIADMQIFSKLATSSFLSFILQHN